MECGEVIDHDEVKEIEGIMNAKARVWIRILGLGEAWGNKNRILQAVSVTGADPPPIYGLPKDLKAWDAIMEHRLRVVQALALAQECQT